MSIVLTCFVELCPFACGATRHVLMFVDLLWSVIGRHEVCWLFVGFCEQISSGHFWVIIDHYDMFLTFSETIQNFLKLIQIFWNYFLETVWNFWKVNLQKSSFGGNFSDLVNRQTVFPAIPGLPGMVIKVVSKWVLSN
jgi:hypothetical protein